MWSRTCFCLAFRSQYPRDKHEKDRLSCPAASLPLWEIPFHVLWCSRLWAACCTVSAFLPVGSTLFIAMWFFFSFFPRLCLWVYVCMFSVWTWGLGFGIKKDFISYWSLSVCNNSIITSSNNHGRISHESHSRNKTSGPQGKCRSVFSH